MSLHRALTKKNGKWVIRDKAGPPHGHHTWNIILPCGRGTNGKHKQKSIRFHGTRPQAEQKERDLRGELYHGEFVEPTKLTVGTYLDEWLKTAIQPRRAANTYTLYKIIIDKYLRPALGHILLQRLTTMHVQRSYAELTPKYGRTKVDATFADATRLHHHAVLTSALNAAVKGGLVHRNVAKLVNNKPIVRHSNDALKNVWTVDEARRFLVAAKQNASPQYAALFALLLDSGLRKGELLGLQWKDLNENQLKVERQLMKCGHKEPIFAPPKRGGVRTIDLSDETVVLLREHRRTQSEVKMANRNHYRDYGLIFAQSWEHVSGKRADLGAGLAPWGINRNLVQLCAIAKVRPITVHGLRHTSATLLLAAGVPPHVVQKRLGHKKIEMTLNLYAHVLPSMQADAASRLAVLLHG